MNTNDFFGRVQQGFKSVGDALGAKIDNLNRKVDHLQADTLAKLAENDQRVLELVNEIAELRYNRGIPTAVNTDASSKSISSVTATSGSVYNEIFNEQDFEWAMPLDETKASLIVNSQYFLNLLLQCGLEFVPQLRYESFLLITYSYIIR